MSEESIREPGREYTGERFPPEWHLPTMMASRGAWWTGVAMLVGSFALIYGLGWLTGAREVAYGVLLTGATVAFFPIIIMVLAVVIPMIVLFLMMMWLLFMLLAAILSGDGGGADLPNPEALDTSPLFEFGAKIFKPYYKAMARIRHPGIWGAALGSLLGAGALMLTLSNYLLAPEKDSTQVIMEISHRLEQIYAETKSYPRPTNSNQLTWESLGVTDQTGPVRDAFDQPLVYTVTGMSRVASWELRSIGFDGKPDTADDLVTRGSTRLARAAGRLGVEQFKGDPSHTDLVQALRALRGASEE